MVQQRLQLVWQWSSSLNHICTYNAIKACNTNPQPRWGQCMQDRMDGRYCFFIQFVVYLKSSWHFRRCTCCMYFLMLKIVITTNNNAYLSHCFMSVMCFFRNGRPFTLTHQDWLNALLDQTKSRVKLQRG